ncbi:MAG: LemA family protein [Chitinophagaceae bacterium]
MKKNYIILLVILVFVLSIGGCGCSSYNSLVKLDEEVKAKWSAVQSSYQRRMDLIPNLVSTVKGASNFEKETLTQVVEARAKATSIQVNPEQLTAQNIQKYQQAQGQLSVALGRLLAISENYPQLKANQNYLELQSQLEGTENRIRVARDDFSNAVKMYNSKVRTFPNNMISGMFGFLIKEGFQAEEGSEKVPTVNF